MNESVEKFRILASQEKFQGWPLVGGYQLGEKIPFFGQILQYTLNTGNGHEDYFSIIRHFGWSVVFAVNTEGKVITLVQWKPGVNQASWELAPGGIGKISPGASLAEIKTTTEQVFLKETGYGDGDWDYLGHLIIETGKYRGSGPNDHGLPAHLFLANGVIKKQDARQPNRNEIIETLEVPLEDFGEILSSDYFVETSAVACAYRALIKLNKLQWQK